MQFLAINGSPRKSWNTAQLLEKMTAGAASAGAGAELVHLRDLSFRGCISCFHCKDPKGSSYGRCVLKDDLRPVLDKAHAADVLVLGSPVYFGVESAPMRACMERLFFQYLIYSSVKPPLSPRKKATALVYTMNVPQEMMQATGMDWAPRASKGCMERFFGSCELFLACDTLQFTDYARYEADMFDPALKRKRHDEEFPRELERAFALGAKLAAQA